MSVGELCPQCKVGHLYPTGKRETSSKSDWPLKEKHEFEKTTLLCDKCGQEVVSIGVSDIAHATDSVNVEKKPT